MKTDLERIQKRLKAARGEIDADLVIAGGLVGNVYTGEWLQQDIALYDGVIVGLGDYPGPRMAVAGEFVVPGFIDGHLHLESSMLTPRELARALVPLGTTAIVADPHEIVNVWGTHGLDYLLAASSGLPLDIFFMLPSCVPASPLSTSGAALLAADLSPYVKHSRVLGLAEVMNFPGTVAGDPQILEKIGLYPHGPVDGHAPLLTGKELNAYRLAGIGSDHECTDLAEAREKLRLGFTLMIREGSLAKNLVDLLPAVTPATLSRSMLVSDDCHPEDLKQRGHLDHLLRLAVLHGLDPLSAITMVTLNPASYFGARDRGAIAPGLAADLVTLRDLENFRADKVWKQGRLVAEAGRLLPTANLPDYPAPSVPLQVKVPAIDALEPQVSGDRVKVIGLVPGQLLTEKLVLPSPLRDGRLGTDTARDLLKLAVVERHHGSGRLGLGLVKGFGIRKGALASTVAHDSHNLVLLGASEEDMIAAANHLMKLGGGLAVVAGGQVLADLPLPVAGLLSLASLEEVAQAHGRLKKAYRSLGGTLADPFMELSFLSLEVIPALKLTDLGLVDVNRFQVVSLFGED
jgi:adenine deaminase|uniref:Adenine deaminase n=1 Tax=Desulfobacca acetoxidans TaxID=60893 RepID=A0A7V6A151_9BACT